MRSPTFFIVLLIVSLIAVLGCDPSQKVRFVNDTNQQVIVFSDGQEARTLKPQEQAVLGYQEYPGTKLFEARTASGTVVSSVSLSWEDLRQEDWTIVFSRE